MSQSIFERPLCFVDCESTGLDTVKDRIVSIAVFKVHLGKENELHFLLDPERPIPPDATAIHGIADEDVKGCVKFAAVAANILCFIGAGDFGSDICGFNVAFDLSLIYEECVRARLDPSPLESANIIDAGTIFKKKEERTLSAAVKFYCGRDLTDAHDALADAKATRDVLLAQLARYSDLPKTSKELAAFSKHDEYVDLAGKIILKNGVTCYGFGKAKGVPVLDDPGFGRWMLAKDFPTQTKKVLRTILDEGDPRNRRDVF